MQQAVKSIEQNLVLQGEAMHGSLISRHGGTDEDFAVGKGNHIGLASIIEKIAMDFRHRGAINQNDFDYVEVCRQGAGQKRKCRLKLPQKRPDPYWNFVLLV